MKILRARHLALLLAVPVYAMCLESTDITNALVSLQDVMSLLERDASSYSNLQEEIEKVSQEFDTSAEIRRRLQCCITYTFDNLNQTFSHREAELLALIAQKDQNITNLEEQFVLAKAEAAQQMQELAHVVDALTQELAIHQQLQAEALDQTDIEQLLAMILELRKVVVLLDQERMFFLSKLEELANKAYGHFEIEAIESTVFGEHICGNLYCPDLDDQVININLVDVEIVESPSEDVEIQDEAPIALEESAQVEPEVGQEASSVDAEDNSLEVEDVAADAQDNVLEVEAVSANSGDASADA